MKVLFIGEGPHEIGHSLAEHNPFQPRRAGGVLPALVRRICPMIQEPVALRWSELSRFRPDVKRVGLSAKVAAAVLLSARRFDCAGPYASTTGTVIRRDCRRCWKDENGA